MKRAEFVLILAVVPVIAAALFAMDRWAALRAVREERIELFERLDKALSLARSHPAAFGANAPPVVPGPEVLKTFAQEAAARRNVNVAYLSETEREGEKGMRERHVVVRVVNAGHANLIAFLEDVEIRGGARVREIHVRPSRSIPDAYEEAEIVFSRLWTEEGG